MYPFNNFIIHCNGWRWLSSVHFGRGGPQECRSSSLGPSIQGHQSGQSQLSSIPFGRGRPWEGTGQRELYFCWAPFNQTDQYPFLPPGASRPEWTKKLVSYSQGALGPELGIWPMPFFSSSICLSPGRDRASREQRPPRINSSY